MSETKLFLSESPNSSKKDFLATAEHLSSFDQNEELPPEIKIDRYTREPWCRLSESKSDKWQGKWFKSTDKRGRLPGFVKFLKGRAKAAYGKFESPEPDEVTGDERTGLFLVPFEQPPYPSKEVIRREGISNVGDLIFVMYCFDERLIFPKGEQQPKQQMPQKPAPMPSVKQARPPQQHKSQSTQQKAPSSSSRGGLLGSLLGRQEQTNRNLQAVPTKRRANNNNSNTSSLPPTINNNHDTSHQEGSNLTQIFTTSNQVIANFRSKIENKLQGFASSSETEMKIPISQAEEIRQLQSMDEKAKVTIDVLKYIVYEQTEEIGMDEWVAAKEPTEFLDEARIAIYKAGYAPAEVLEEINKAELPDEAKQQQHAMREALNREEKKKAKLEEEQNLKNANVGQGQNNDFKRLNCVKRDRRSIEEIQRDMMSDMKRPRN